MPFALSVATKLFMLSVVMLNVIMLNVVMVNVVMLNVVMVNVVMLNVVMVNVIMVNAIMINVITLNVIMLNVVASFSFFVLHNESFFVEVAKKFAKRIKKSLFDAFSLLFIFSLFLC